MITVLVAADADWLQTLVQSSLLADDARIVAVKNGREVRAAMLEHRPDVAVLDMQIGSMGGIAVALDLQLEAADGRMPAIPVVLLLDREADQTLAERVRADAVLVKPLDASQLRSTVLQLVEGFRTAQLSG
ncbi:MAG: response regulator [Acidimicrobiia bacterium]